MLGSSLVGASPDPRESEIARARGSRSKVRVWSPAGFGPRLGAALVAISSAALVAAPGLRAAPPWSSHTEVLFDSFVDDPLARLDGPFARYDYNFDVRPEASAEAGDGEPRIEAQVRAQSLRRPGLEESPARLQSLRVAHETRGARLQVGEVSPDEDRWRRAVALKGIDLRLRPDGGAGPAPEIRVVTGEAASWDQLGTRSENAAGPVRIHEVEVAKDGLRVGWLEAVRPAPAHLADQEDVAQRLSLRWDRPVAPELSVGCGVHRSRREDGPEADAWRLELKFADKQRPIRGELRVEDQEADFHALASSASPGRRTVATRWELEPAEWLRLEADFRRDLDDRGEAVGPAVETRRPKLRAILSPAGTDMRLRFDLSSRETEAVDGSRDDRTRSWKLRLEERLGKLRTVVGYGAEAFRDHTSFDSRDSGTWSLSVDQRVEVSPSLTLTPRAAFERRKDEQGPVEPGSEVRLFATDTLRLGVGMVFRPGHELSVGYRKAERVGPETPDNHEKGTLDLGYRIPFKGDARQGIRLGWRRLRSEVSMGPRVTERRTQLAVHRNF